MKVGNIVVGAQVSRLEPWGAFLEWDGQTIFVQIVELDWIKKVPDATAFATIGDEFDVLVMGYSEEKGIYWGSIKQAHPEKAPWIDDGTFAVGTRHRAKVTMNTDYGTFVELTPGVEGLVLREAGGGHLPPQDTVTVEITELDIATRRIRASRVAS